MKSATLLLPILLLAFLIVAIIFVWGSPVSYFSHRASLSSCCSKDNAGCGCRNPKYFGLVGHQSDRSVEVKDLEGILIDARCYALTRDNYTNSHSFPPDTEKVAKGCATACAKSGVPVAILLGSLPPGPDSQAIVLLHPSPNLAKHMEKKARVSGYFMKDMQAIFTTCVEVLEKDGKWKDTCFTTPMIKMAKGLSKKERLNLPAKPSFAKDVRGLFRDSDVETMKALGLDLSSYSDVKDRAEDIYSRVKDGSMPCDAAWDESKVTLFRKWIDTGMSS